MPLLPIVEAVETLRAPALTVRAQARPMPALRWPILMPRADVDSVKVRDAIASILRPVADRREWNGEGRRIPMLAPALRELEMIPVEATDKIEEYELQRLYEMNLAGNAGQVDALLTVRLPRRVDVLVDAVWNRLEVDGLTMWHSGKIIARDPQTGRAVETSYGIDATRYAQVASAWTSTSVNAYDEFLTWLRSAIIRSGPMAGVVLRTEAILRILKDAPTGAANGVPGPRLTITGLNARIAEEIGSAFQFVPLDDTLDVFTDGGITTTPTKLWPGNKIAAIPAGSARVAAMAFAPVVKAARMAAEIPQANIDIRGVTVTYEESNNGLQVKAQANAMPVPDPNRVEVLDTGLPA